MKEQWLLGLEKKGLRIDTKAVLRYVEACRRMRDRCVDVRKNLGVKCINWAFKASS